MAKQPEKLSHVDASGKASMVDVGSKEASRREAWARSEVALPDEVAALLTDDEIATAKGPVFQTAVIAGVMAAKKTGELIPFCHPLSLDNCNIEISVNEKNIAIIDCRVSITAKTGVEMEALTGASVAALAVYDMCKAVSHDIVIKETKLMSKTGGKSDFRRT